MAVSATLAANEIIERKRSAGETVLPMGFGEAGLPVHPALRAALAGAAGRGGYGPVCGTAELRAAAAGYWGRRELPTDPELVVAGPGSKPLLYAVLHAIGGDVAIARPSWVSYAAQADLLGVEAHFVDTRPGKGGVPDPDLLAEMVARSRAAGRQIRSVVVTLPDNPTGTLASPELVRELCEVARREDLIIVSDEIYRDLVHEPTTPYLSPADVAGERTVVTTALSKNLALGGWRIGVARLPHSPRGARLRERLATVASEIWSSPVQPVQHAAALAFGEPPTIVERVNASRRLHALVANAVAERFAAAGCELARPAGGFYLYPDFEPYRDHLAREWSVKTGPDLAGVLLERFGVGVLPGVAFGDPEDALRLRVATSLLYGDLDEQRETSLTHPDPLSLPWIRASLDRVEHVLTELCTPPRAIRASVDS